MVRDEFALSPEQIFLKQRRRQKGSAQYEKQGTESGSYGLGSVEAFTVVEEGGLKFYVNFEKYLDTGLFLTTDRCDPRSSNKRQVNLFSICSPTQVRYRFMPRRVRQEA